ncbi:Serine/threonine kinase [Entophlyctis sp. JEL0112]|nr:Serine/threonine kinase [Entophlyctis sp. JEL0112]
MPSLCGLTTELIDQMKRAIDQAEKLKREKEIMKAEKSKAKEAADRNQTAAINEQKLKSSSVPAAQIVSPDTERFSVIASEGPHTAKNARNISRGIGLDDFNLITVLGKGNFGKVILVEEKLTKKNYAIKVLKKDFVIENDEAEATRAEKRVFLTANLERFPFLVNLHSCFQTETRLYFVMEFVSGGDLMWHIQHERFSEKRAKFYACEVLLALEYFHKNNITYRDLKLDNILLTLDGHIKIADYGLFSTATFCGTPEFMAPEILKEKPYTRAVDWWALGVLIYEMILGQSPFPGDGEDQIFDAILHDDVLFPANMNKDAADLLRKVEEYICIQFLNKAQQLMAKDPNSRLGGGVNDAEDIKGHQYFSSVNWDDVLNLRIPPPFFPTIKSASDTSNFDEEFTKEPPVLTPINTILSAADQEEFRVGAVEQSRGARLETGDRTNICKRLAVAQPPQALGDDAAEDSSLLSRHPSHHPHILTSALIRALSPDADPDREADTDSSESNEEIFNLKETSQIGDTNRDMFRFAAAVNTFRWHPKVWIWNNRHLLSLVLLTIALGYRFSNQTGSQVQQTVVLISLDGFREEYLSRGFTPNIAALVASGISASFMTPVFPSLTFPNHYSIVTGLYPESHGIVGNVFFDPELNDTFVYVDSTKNKESKWWGGEPIWVTAAKNGLKTSTCMWPGSEALIQGVSPTYVQPYNGSMSNSERVAKVLDWLSLPWQKRPVFLTLYMNDVDSAGHSFGPDSAQVNTALKSVDNAVGNLVRGILDVQRVSKLQHGTINLMIVSDHGMAVGAPVENFIYVDDYVSADAFDIVNNVVVSIYPKYENDTASILESLQLAALNSSNWHVWSRDSVPVEFHYSHNARIGPIVAMPDEGYGLSVRSQAPSKKVGGMHGYNNTDKNMRAIFVAAGPAFKSSGHLIVGNESGNKEWEENNDALLGVDSNGDVVSAHIGAAVGGHPGFEFKPGFWSGWRRGGDGSARTPKSHTPGVSTTVASDGMEEVVEGTNGNMSVQVLPSFTNVEVYNLCARILGIGRDSRAPNNGTRAGMALFEPWLNI